MLLSLNACVCVPVCMCVCVRACFSYPWPMSLPMSLPRSQSCIQASRIDRQATRAWGGGKVAVCVCVCACACACGCGYARACARACACARGCAHARASMCARVLVCALVSQLQSMMIRDCAQRPASHLAWHATRHITLAVFAQCMYDVYSR